MKNRKLVIITSIIGIILFLGIIIVSYAYFSVNIENNDNLNVSVNIIQGSGYTFVVNGTVNTELNIAGTDMLYDENLANNAIAFNSNEAAFNVSLKSKSDTTCEYDLYWVWDTTSDAYTKTEGATNELEYTLSNTTNTYTNQINNSYDDLLIASSSIRSSGNVTATTSYTANLKFYNLNLVQDAHAGKTYSGYFAVKNVDCFATGTVVPLLIDYLTDQSTNPIYTNLYYPKYCDMDGDGSVEVCEMDTDDDGIIDFKGDIVDGNNYLIDFSELNTGEDEPFDGGIKFAGPNPNNYVRFNNELWRIVGIYGSNTHNLEDTKLIKIIRAEPLYENLGYGNYISYGSNNLEYTLANSTYASSTLIQTNVKQYFREIYNYTMGSIGSYQEENLFADFATDGSSTYLEGAVFIPQFSDYMGSTTGVSVGDYMSCISEGYDVTPDDDTNNCALGSWMTPASGHSYWTSGFKGSNIWIVNNNSVSYVAKTETHDVYPVVYLKQSTKLVSGTGTESDPYIIK